MRALVTGATGFIGRYLVRELLDRGWQVICLSREQRIPTTPYVTSLCVDFGSPESLRRHESSLGQLDAVFHLAALLPDRTEGYNPEPYIAVNTLGTAALLRMSVNIKVPVFIFMSSLSLIGKPLHLPITEEHPVQPEHPYFVSKLAAEHLCEQASKTHGLRAVSLRLTSPYGPGMAENTVLPRFVRAAIASEDITIHGTGQRTQNFVHVSDVVKACMLAVKSDAAGIFNLGGASSIAMRDLAAMAVKMVPGTGSKVIESSIFDPQEEYRWHVDLSKIKWAISYVSSISLDLGVRELKDFFSSGADVYKWWEGK